MKKNIGIVTTWFERGAAYVSRQYMDTIKKTENVFIYVRGGEEYAQKNAEWALPNVTWGKKVAMPDSVATYVNPFDFKKWLAKNNIDIVFFNEQHYWQPVLLCNRLGLKTCTYVDYYTEQTIPLFGLFDILICNTKRHFEAFSWHKQAFYIPWGTQTDVFIPPEDKTSSPDGVIRFFHSAGMNPYRKGTDYVLRAFEMIIKEGIKNIQLILHLQTDLLSFFPELKETLTFLKQKKCLTLIKKTIQRPGLYHMGDVYVYPSRLDGIGLTLAEALSCGLPLVTPDNPPMNEFALSQGSELVKINRLFARNDGYYWPQCSIDIQDLVKKMKQFTRHPENMQQFSINARNYALEKLDWEKNSMGLRDILLNCDKLTPSEHLFKKATNFDNRKFTGITKIPWAFSLFVRLKRRFIKK